MSAAPPTLGLTANSPTVGGTIQATAQLSEGPNASGQISFEVFGPNDPDCSGTTLAPAPAPATVSGEGQYVSGEIVPPSAGVYHWSAHYSGDLEPADSTCSATSTVGKATPTLDGAATSVTEPGQSITDNVTLAGGFGPSGQLVFRAYGPGDETCASGPKYEEIVAVNGNGSYAPAGFSPPPGLYRWTANYGGDANNEAASTACGDTNSAVGSIFPTLTAGASNGVVGNSIHATATIRNGATPTGEIAFKAYPPSDATCSGTAAFSSVVSVSGNGSYSSANFAPTRVGTFRWTVAYSGDVNHAPAAAICGTAISAVSQAKPTVTGKVSRRLKVGARFRDSVTLLGGFAPTGTITFRIYGPGAAGCSQPAFVNTVAVNDNGTYNSDPFVAKRPGRYSFVATYSGDIRNQAATEPCDSVDQVVRVQKRTPKVKPRAILIGGKRISIRASLAGGSTPSGAISFRLYGPGNTRCKGRPAFGGSRTVGSNGTFALAEYLAAKPGVYRLVVGYSGDPRNARYKSGCANAQSIPVGTSR